VKVVDAGLYDDVKLTVLMCNDASDGVGDVGEMCASEIVYFPVLGTRVILLRFESPMMT
jgi:hypothetical protein